MSDREVGVLGRIPSLTITVGLVCGFSAIVFIILYATLPQHRSLIGFSLSTLGGAAVVYAGYFAGRTLAMQVRRDRKKCSFAILETLNSVDLVEIRLSIEGIDSKELSQAALCDKIREDQELREAVTLLLGILEDASIAIQENYADEVILEKSLGFIVPWAYSKLQGWIQHERKNLAAEGLFRELERLNIAWSDSHYLLTGKPFSH